MANLKDTGFTSILLHMDGLNSGVTFTDETGRSWSGSGVTTDTSVFKFGTSSANYANANGYIYTADHIDLYLPGDFTMDMWLRFSDFPVSGGYYQLYQQYQGSNDWGTFAFKNDGGVHSFNYRIYVGASDVLNFVKACPSNLSLNTWYHVRLCRNGNDYKVYLNGSKIGTTTTDSGTNPNFTGSTFIGSHDASANFFKGWIDEFRLVKGVAEVTGDTFNVPGVAYSPHVDDAYTIHLCHFNGPDGKTTCADMAGTSSFVFADNAQIDTAQYKFGTSSLLLDGTGDWLTAADDTRFNLAVYDFTIEMNVRFHALPAAAGYMGMWQHYQSVSNDIQMFIHNVGGTYYLCCEVYVGGVAQFAEARELAGIATDTWYHFAWSRESQVNRFFWDGTKLGADSPDSTSFPDIIGSIYIGALNNGSGFNGWIDEYRFSVGVSRYNAAFTPETSAFGSIIDNPETLTTYDQYALFDNVIEVDLPISEVGIGTTMEWRAINIVLPLNTLGIHSYTGDISFIEIPLPIFNMASNSLTGSIGSIDMALPIGTPSFFGGGHINFSMPIDGASISSLTGQVSGLSLLLDKLVLSIASHVNEFSRIDIKLPVDSVHMAGLLNGIGSLLINMPLPTFAGHTITGSLGQIDFTLPNFKVNVNSYYNDRIIMDIDLPAIVVDLYGRYIPITINYKGVTVNTRTMAVTENNNLTFNSSGTLGTKVFGANENGIYMMGGINDKESRIETGSFDFGRNALGVPRDVWLSLRTDGKMILSLKVNETDQYDYEILGMSDHIHEERVKVGRGLVGRFNSFIIRNIDGADFDLSKLEMFADIKTSRKR